MPLKWSWPLIHLSSRRGSKHFSKGDVVPSPGLSWWKPGAAVLIVREVHGTETACFYPISIHFKKDRAHNLSPIVCQTLLDNLHTYLLCSSTIIIVFWVRQGKKSWDLECFSDYPRTQVRDGRAGTQTWSVWDLPMGGPPPLSLVLIWLLQWCHRAIFPHSLSCSDILITT